MTVRPLHLPNRKPGGALITAIYGDKGGIGKSTIAQHLAYGIGSRGLGEVVVIDVNAEQKTSSSMTIFSELKVEPCYRCTVEDKPANLARVRDVPGVDHIIMDLPPSPREAKAALEQSDLVVIPAVPEHLTMRGVMETIQRVVPPGPHPVVLLNRTPSRGDKEPPAIVTLRQGFAGMNVRVFDTALRQYAAHHHAQGSGIPLVHSPNLYDRGDKAAADVNALVDEFVAMTKGEQQK